MNKKLFEKYIKSLPKNAVVLDAGCGSGNNSRYVHMLRPDIKIHAVDIDDSKKQEVPKYVKFSQASIDNLKLFKNSLFDCVLCFHVLEHMRRPERAVSEFNRVLNRKGIIFAESPHWITAITPIGRNFYDDYSHIRPHTKRSFKDLFRPFSVKYLRFETSIFYYLDGLYGLKKSSISYIFRKILKMLGLYKTSVFIIAVKR